MHDNMRFELLNGNQCLGDAGGFANNFNFSVALEH
jgi:hypothetical protein